SVPDSLFRRGKPTLTAITPTGRHLVARIWKGPRGSAHILPTLLAYMTCTATCGNGAPITTIGNFIAIVRVSIPRDLRPDPYASSAAGPVTTSGVFAGRPIASALHRPIAIWTSDFGS